MNPTKSRPLKCNPGWLFQDSGEELAAFQQHYGVSLPATFVNRVWPYAGGLLSSTRKAGDAAGKSVSWLTLLKLRLPKDYDWEVYHRAVEHQKVSPNPQVVFHDLIPVYLEQLRERFFDTSGTLRFLPFGGAYRLMPKPEGREQGFLCFEVRNHYAIWYLPAEKREEYLLAESFEAMMAVPQRKKK